MIEVHLQKDAIDIPMWFSKLGTDSDGAVVSFTGSARNISKGREVLYLYYETYGEMAQKELEKIAVETTGGWSLNSCIIIHRYGKVEVGEPSIFIGVSSPHRSEAFGAARHIIDSIKETVPIWKKEHYRDGSAWITDHA